MTKKELIIIAIIGFMIVGFGPLFFGADEPTPEAQPITINETESPQVEPANTTVNTTKTESPQVEPANTTVNTTKTESPLMAEPPQESEPVQEPEPVQEEATYIRYQLTDYERDMVERVVTTEALNQPLIGQMAVAQCILNTAEAKGIRPDAVVLAPGQYAAPSRPDRVSDSVKQAVSAVFDKGETVTTEPIRYFYAPKYCSGSWHESSLVYVTTIEDHKFFKLP